MTDSIDPRRTSTILAWMRLARIFHNIDRRTSDRFKCHDISVARFDVLNHAGTPEGRTQQELARALLVTKGNITQLLDAMECEGVIERRRVGRSKQIHLTDEGRARRAMLVDLQERALIDEFGAFSDDELDTLVRLLRKLERSLRPDHDNVRTDQVSAGNPNNAQSK